MAHRWPLLSPRAGPVSAIAPGQAKKGANQTLETNTPNQPSVQLSYPTDKLVAIIDAMPDAEHARHELIEAGFAPDAIGLQHGTRGAEHTVHSTDFDPFPHLARLLHVHSIEHEQAVIYEQALRIMEAYNARYVNFYGK